MKPACNGTARFDIVFHHKHVSFNTDRLFAIWVFGIKILVNLKRFSVKYNVTSCPGSVEERFHSLSSGGGGGGGGVGGSSSSKISSSSNN